MTDTTQATEVTAEKDFSIPDTATTKIDEAYWRGRLAELVDKYKVPGAALGILRTARSPTWRPASCPW